jgi:hypothetical protein
MVGVNAVVVVSKVKLGYIASVVERIVNGGNIIDKW